MQRQDSSHWARVFALSCLVLGSFCHVVPDFAKLLPRSTITVNVDTTLTTTVSGTQATTLVTSSSIVLTDTSEIVSYIQTAIPSDVRSESSYACFVNSQYNYYPTPSWYSSLAPAAQSYYSSVNQGNTAACTSSGTSSTGTSAPTQQGSSNGGLSTGAKVGIAFGAIGALAAVLSALWSIFKGNPCGHSSAKPTPAAPAPAHTPSQPMAQTSGPAHHGATGSMPQGVTGPMPQGATSPPPGYQSPNPMSQPSTPGWDGQAGSQAPPPWSGTAGGQAPPGWNGAAGGQAPPGWSGVAGNQGPPAWSGVAGSQVPPTWDGSAGSQAPSAWNGQAGGQAPSGWDGSAGSQAPPTWNGTAGADAPPNAGNQTNPGWNGWAGSDAPAGQAPPFNGQAGGGAPGQPAPGWDGIAGGGGGSTWSGAAGTDGSWTGTAGGPAPQGGAGQIPFIPIVGAVYRRDKEKKEPQQRTSSYAGSDPNHSGHASPVLVGTTPMRDTPNELPGPGTSSHSPWVGYSNESVRAEMPVYTSPVPHQAQIANTTMMAQPYQRTASAQSIPRRPVGSRRSSGAQGDHGATSPQLYPRPTSGQGSYNTQVMYPSPTRHAQAFPHESGSNTIYESGSRTIHEADEVYTRQPPTQ